MSNWIRWWKYKDVLIFVGLVLFIMVLCFLTVYWQQNLLGLFLVAIEMFILGFPLRKYGKKVLEIIANNV